MFIFQQLVNVVFSLNEVHYTMWNIPLLMYDSSVFCHLLVLMRVLSFGVKCYWINVLGYQFCFEKLAHMDCRTETVFIGILKRVIASVRWRMLFFVPWLATMWNMFVNSLLVHLSVAGKSIGSYLRWNV